ncbi:adenine phosphoribosyltransferase [Flavobacteriaceae bacterium R38]|nr:adenine phosphoribosyltransferase [Flavobacteriaceae bacterium R38]
MNLEHYIRDVKDFPEKGIIFKDITPLLNDAGALKQATTSLLGLIGEQKVDKVIGMESRGFFFATLLATQLNAGFVPVRKVGKLPSDKISEAYGLEYGTDTLEIHTDAIKKGDRVLIHDDVLATGGTAEAVCKLVERLGGVIIQCNFLIELTFLNGRARLDGFETKSLLSY